MITYRISQLSRCLAVAVAAISLISTSYSETLAGWNFDGSSTATTSGVQQSTATLTSNASGLTYFTGVSGQALAIVGDTNNNRYITFNLSMTGFQDLTLDFSTRGTSTGFSSGLWSYSTNGSSFTTLPGVNTATTATSFSAKNVSFASIDALDGAANVYIRYTLNGATTSNGNNRLDNIVFSATAFENNTSILNAPTTASVGRVMQNSSTTTNVSVTRTGTGDADFSTTTDNAIAPATGTIAGSSGSVAVGVDTSATGIQEGTVTFVNESNAADTAPNKTVTVTGTVVADRQIDGSVNVGKVFVGTTVSGTATLATTGDSDNFTNVTVNGNAVTDVTSSGTASVLAGTTTVFNDASDTTVREVDATFTQSGNGQSITADLNVTGEGLSGENAGATVTVQADVFQHALLATNDNETLGDGGFVTVTNEFNNDGGQRAAAVISSETVNGTGWSASALSGDPGSTPGVIAETETVTANVSFDSTNKLNGTHVGSLVVGFEDEAGIAGGGSLGSKTWTLSQEVFGNTAQTGVAQTATVLATNSFAGFGATHDSGLATDVALRAGTATGNVDVSLTFSNIAPSTLAGVANDAGRVSDLVSLEGTGSNVIVLQMSYNDAGVIDESTLAMFWLADGAGEWTLATSGNTGSGALAGAYAMSYDAFLAANGGVFDALTMLGAYGVDTAGNTTWAVINHNSDFAVNVVPEPGSVALVVIGGALLCGIRRRYQARA